LRHILHQVATNARCRMWYTQGANTSTVAGFSSDVLFTEMLFSSIRAYMNFRYAMALAHGKTSHPKTFRNEFCAGFRDRIVERLKEQLLNQEAWLNDHQTSTGTSTSLVIRDRRRKVNDWVDERISLRSSRPKAEYVRDVNARAQGRIAAETADLSGGRGGKLRSARKELNR
jgi:hypothetical protein